MAGFAASRPLAHEPGTTFNYSSGTTNIVSGIVARTLGGEQAYRRYLQERLFDPIGMRSADPRFDAAGTWVASSYLWATGRDMARFGYLYLRDGPWDGERLLPPGLGGPRPSAPLRSTPWTCGPTAPSGGSPATTSAPSGPTATRASRSWCAPGSTSSSCAWASRPPTATRRSSSGGRRWSTRSGRHARSSPAVAPSGALHAARRRRGNRPPAWSHRVRPAGRRRGCRRSRAVPWRRPGSRPGSWSDSHAAPSTRRAAATASPAAGWRTRRDLGHGRHHRATLRRRLGRGLEPCRDARIAAAPATSATADVAHAAA